MTIFFHRKGQAFRNKMCFACPKDYSNCKS
ncbi:hypothetical protein M2092_001581 [Fusobacterium sp. PH5-44]